MVQQEGWLCSSASEISGPSKAGAPSGLLLLRRPVVARKTEAVSLRGTTAEDIAVWRHRLFSLLDALFTNYYGLHGPIDQLARGTVYRSKLIHLTKQLISKSRLITSMFSYSPLRATVVRRSSIYGFGRRNISPNSYPIATEREAQQWPGIICIKERHRPSCVQPGFKLTMSVTELRFSWKQIALRSTPDPLFVPFRLQRRQSYYLNSWTIWYQNGCHCSLMLADSLSIHCAYVIYGRASSFNCQI